MREKLEENDDDVTCDKIANEMNIAVSEVAYALDAISDPVSLYEPVYNKSGDTLLLMDQIFDDKNNDEVWTEKAALYEAIERLETVREENPFSQILRARLKQKSLQKSASPKPK